MTPEALHRLVFDFRVARAVFAGVELGLFEALAGPPEPSSEVAHAAACDAGAVEVWLEALEAAGIVERSGAGWQIPAALRDCLVPGADGYLGNLFLHDAWHWSRWAALEEVLRTGRPVEGHEGDHHLSRPDVLSRFLPNYNEAMQQSARGAAEILGAVIAEHPPRRVVDFGGGCGDVLAAVCQLVPGTRGVLVEHAFALEGARANLVRSPARECIELVAMDFEKEAAPAPYDAAVLSRVLMGMPPVRAASALQRVTAGLEPGGRLYVHDFDPGTRVGALLGLDMLLNTGGQVHSAAQVRGWMEQASLRVVEERPVLPYTRVWTGRREG